MRHTVLLCACVLAGVVALSSLGAAPASLTGHDEHRTNYTVRPQDSPADRRPTATAVSYEHYATLDAIGEGQQTLLVDTIVVRWADGSVAACSDADVAVLGIDRGNDAPGTHVDDRLDDVRIEHTRNATRISVQDGATVRLGVADQLVLVEEDCYDNPDERSWIRFWWYVNGTNPDGEGVSTITGSNRVGICDCEDREEARNVLGPDPYGTPPPSPTPMATPEGASPHTSTSSPTPEILTSPRRSPSPSTHTPSPTPTARWSLPPWLPDVSWIEELVRDVWIGIAVVGEAERGDAVRRM